MKILASLKIWLSYYKTEMALLRVGRLRTRCAREALLSREARKTNAITYNITFHGKYQTATTKSCFKLHFFYSLTRAFNYEITFFFFVVSRSCSKQYFCLVYEWRTSEWDFKLNTFQSNYENSRWASWI